MDFSNREALREEVSNDGSVVLEWSAGDREVELQQASDPGFTDAATRYQGTDPASALTGLEEGSHYFRIREAGTGTWSPPLEVEVRFVSRTTLMIYLSVGGLVALLTAGAIIAGFLKTRERRTS